MDKEGGLSMNKKSLKTVLFAFMAISCISSCQDIDSTYDKGDGEIRYIGMCDNLTTSPGWKRIIVNWTNNVDPVIDKIKVRWSDDNMADSVLLDRGTTEYSIQNLEDNTYSIKVVSVDKNGNESLSNTTYDRPYTENHEEVRAFTRIIAKQYFLGDQLILSFAGWQDGIDSAILKYTKKDGTSGDLQLTAALVANSIYTLPDKIDSSKPITLYREGRIKDCPDEIVFEPYELSHQKSYSSDLKDFIKQKYGMGSEQMSNDGNINEEWAENVKTLEIDANLNSFEDVLNFPKLNKLVLGKNTYLTELGAEDETRGQYQLYEPTISKLALDIMHAYNGLSIERYNKHFKSLPKLNYLKEMGTAPLPTLELYDLSKADISLSPADAEGYDSHPKFLIDGNVSSCWQPLQTTSQQTYTLTIDLGKEVEASGLKVVQKYFSEYDNDNDIAPQKVTTEIADHTGVFKDATHEHENYIGTSPGQTILLPFASGKQSIRYIRVTIPSQYYHSYYNVTLAEIGLYK